MAKVQQFKHKPGPYEYGQYYYEGDSPTIQSIDESAAVRKPYDKYEKQTLETTITTDVTRDKIIDNRLRKIGDSFIRINNLRIDNRGVNHKIKNTHFRGFLFDRNTFDCFNSDGQLKSYNELDVALYKSRKNGDASTDTNVSEINYSFGGGLITYSIIQQDESRLFDFATIFNWNAPRYNKGKAPKNLDFLEDKIILQNLSANDNPGDNFTFDEITHGSSFFDEISNYTLNSNSTDEDGLTLNQPFNPMDNKSETTDRFTSIFNENNENNYLQFLVWMRGDARRFIGTKKRKKSIAVVKISPFELFDNNYNSLGPKRFDFENPKQVYGGGGSTAAFKLSNLSLTIDATQGASIEDFQLPDGTTPDNEILSSMQSRVPLSNSNFYFDFLKTTLYDENYTIREGASPDANFRYNFIPISEIKIDGVQGTQSTNLQMYKTDETDKKICSSPNKISLSVYLSTKLETEEDRILPREYDYLNANIPPFYKFAVINWDDKDDLITSVDDYFDLKPNTYSDLIRVQENDNLFIFKDGLEKLTNIYRTSGLKKIKIIMFSYVPFLSSDSIPNDYSYLPPFDKIEILRYKLITSKIYLEQSPADFQDFSEIGGSDYVTIPFNNTVPIIGGVDDKSQYKISIKNTLNSPNITEADVDELNLLRNDIENDELGESIKSMDLEQCRYFNGSYDMNTLLNIEPIQQTDIQYEEDLQPVNYFFNSIYNDPDAIDYYGQEYLESPEFLATLPFPQYREEFDINGDGGFNINDTVGWGLQKREDIALLINYLLSIGAPFPSQFTYPDYVSSWTTTDDIPSAAIPIGSESFNQYTNSYWDGDVNKFPMESSVGQIFISDNQDTQLKNNCKLELNTGELIDKSIYDSSGESNKGILIGDYKVKKTRKGEPMRRDSFIKTPRKSKQNRAL